MICLNTKMKKKKNIHLYANRRKRKKHKHKEGERKREGARKIEKLSKNWYKNLGKIVKKARE